ncbi:uncharacterized protein LOC117101947 [Anneissia japonica]|uniref:uncharacterized protein LOC117101947 n=1 Tax=Anneissia japonica TaxID=1529436 RepID=UPI0014256EC1|nr:uncharacterized protein LOC117101947 [Anneissia japonica]
MASKQGPTVKPKPPKKVPVWDGVEDTVYENPEALAGHESMSPSYGIPKKITKKRSTSDTSESIRRRLSNFELSIPRQRVSSFTDTDRLSDSDNIYDPVALDEDPRDQHVHPIRPIARVQGYKVQPEVHNVGWQSGSHSAGTLKESKSFLENVEWLYDSVKETREMYELDEVLRAVLFEGELRMFRHMDVIEETLYRYIAL